MRYRRRFFIPLTFRNSGQQAGHLIWQDGAMEAWTADGELVGAYATRREAAAALWKALERQGKTRGSGGWTSATEDAPDSWAHSLSGNAIKRRTAWSQNSPHTGKT
jgi:hypothetical protein